MTKNLTIRTKAGRRGHLPSMPMKCRVILPFIAMLILAVPARAENVTGYDRFQLWNDCQPMRLVVEGLDKDTTDIGLTKDAITVAVRSRLRAARLYTAETDPRLYVRVQVVDTAFYTSVEYGKRVADSASGGSTVVTTWGARSIGTHSRNASYILSPVSENVDKFIDEYLRVNEDACKR